MPDEGEYPDVFIDRVGRILWREHVAGRMTWDEWITMMRIYGAANEPLQRFIVTEP